MASIIDTSYFVREIAIPNIAPSYTGRNAPSLERVQSFIDRYETECLVKILGYSLAQRVLLEIKMSKDETTPIEMSEAIKRLIYGVMVDMGFKWEGLIYEPNGSLIADYIFYMYKRDDSSKDTGSATVVPKIPETGTYNNIDRMVFVWNRFSYCVADMQYFLWMNRDDYPEFTQRDAINTARNSRMINGFDL